MIDSLTDPDLLRRCLRGATQNVNESINSVVWSILPKSKYHGYRSIRGVASIASIFSNHDRSGLIKFFDEVDIAITDEFLFALLGKDRKRIDKAMAHTRQRDQVVRKKDRRLKTRSSDEEETDYSAAGCSKYYSFCCSSLFVEFIITY